MPACGTRWLSSGKLAWSESVQVAVANKILLFLCAPVSYDLQATTAGACREVTLLKAKQKLIERSKRKQKSSSDHVTHMKHSVAHSTAHAWGRSGQESLKAWSMLSKNPFGPVQLLSNNQNFGSQWQHGFGWPSFGLNNGGTLCALVLQCSQVSPTS